jgi:hypothetical protein
MQAIKNQTFDVSRREASNNLLHEQSPSYPQFLSYEQQLVLLPPAKVYNKEIKQIA